MQKLSYALIVVALLVASFFSGYYYRSARASTSAEIEDYALSNILEDVAYAHYLAHGDYANLRSLLDVSLNAHVSRARANFGANVTEGVDPARTRTLNALAVIWAQQPPFQSAEWRESEANASWWHEWESDHKKNLAFLNDAKARCASNPKLSCKAQPPLKKHQITD